MSYKSIKEMIDLSEKVCIVTGSTKGLGYSMVTALAEYGADVIITSRELKKAQDSAADVKKLYGTDTLGLELDQSKEESIVQMVKDAVAFKGHVDVLVNNAYLWNCRPAPGNFLERDYSMVRDQLNINLLGPMMCAREVAKHMVERKSGKIINIGSISGLMGRDKGMYRKNGMSDTPVDYGVIKGAITEFSRDLAAFLGEYSICVNTLTPGGFNNGGRLPQGFVDDFSAITMLRHLGDPDNDLKGAIVYLASDSANYVTGQNIVVDGGFSTLK